MQYSNFKQIIKNEQLSILKAKKDGNQPVVIITMADFPTFITRNYINELYNYVDYAQNDRECSLVLVEVQGTPLAKFLKNPELTYTQRTQVAHEYLKKLEKYDYFPDNVKNQLIDSQQVVITNEGVLLREICNFAAKDIVSNKDIMYTIGKTLNMILPDAENSDAFFIEQLLTGTVSYDSFAKTFKTFREVFIYENTESLAKGRKPIIILNDTTKPSIGVEDVLKFEYEESLRKHREDKIKKEKEYIKKLEQTDDALESRIDLELEVTENGLKNTLNPEVKGITPADMSNFSESSHEYIVGDSISSTNINPKLIGLSISPITQYNDYLEKDRSDNTISTEQSLSSKETETQKEYQPEEKINYETEEKIDHEKIYDNKVIHEVDKKIPESVNHTENFTKEIDDTKKQENLAHRFDKLEEEIMSFSIKDNSEDFIDIPFESKILSNKSENNFIPDKNKQKIDPKVFEQSTSATDKVLAEAVWESETDKLVAKLQSDFSPEEDARYQKGKKRTKNIMTTVILVAIVGIIFTIAFFMLEPVEASFKYKREGDNSIVITNTSKGGFKTKSYLFEVYLGGSLIHTTEDKDTTFIVPVSGEYTIKLYAIDKSGEKSEPFEQTIDFKFNEN